MNKFPLVDYARQNNVEKITFLLEEKEGINRFDEGLTEVHAACSSNALDAA